MLIFATGSSYNGSLVGNRSTTTAQCLSEASGNISSATYYTPPNNCVALLEYPGDGIVNFTTNYDIFPDRAVQIGKDGYPLAANFSMFINNSTFPWNSTLVNDLFPGYSGNAHQFWIGDAVHNCQGWMGSGTGAIGTTSVTKLNLGGGNHACTLTASIAQYLCICDVKALITKTPSISPSRKPSRSPTRKPTKSPTVRPVVG